jgi:cytochrome P450
VLEASETTRISDDLQMAVWGDDAPEVWVQMSHEPARRCQNVVLVSATEDVRPVLAEHRTFSSGPEASFIGSDTGLIPLQVDPPEHVRYRRMLDPLFAPKRMAALEQDVRTLAKRQSTLTCSARPSTAWSPALASPSSACMTSVTATPACC